MYSPRQTWPYSERLGGRYWYDYHSDFILTPQGNFPRPADIPREVLLSACPQPLNQQNVHPQFQEQQMVAANYTIARGPPALSMVPGQPAVSRQAAVYPAASQPLAAQYQSLAERARSDPLPAFGALGIGSAPQAGGPSPEEIPRPVTAEMRREQGATYIQTRDGRNEVRTLFQTEPADKFTDPALRKLGVTAKRYLLGTADDEEKLFASFKKQQHAARFFKTGKVFMVLWVEPAGESTVTYLQAGESRGRYGERVFSKVRRFVVIRESQGYCSALPITTYGRRGVSKPGVIKSEHAIIYTGRNAPEPIPDELPVRGESGMRPRAIRVDADQKDDKLDDLSRIDFGKVTTVQHNVKTKSFGMVNSASLDALLQQAKNVWGKVPEEQSQPTSQTADTTVITPPYQRPAPPNPARISYQAQRQRTGVAERRPTDRPRDSVLSAESLSPVTSPRRPTQDAALTEGRRTDRTRSHGSTQKREQSSSEESSDDDDGDEEEDDEEDDEEEQEVVAPERAAAVRAVPSSGSNVARAVTRPSAAASSTVRRPSIQPSTPASSTATGTVAQFSASAGSNMAREVAQPPTSSGSIATGATAATLPSVSSSSTATRTAAQASASSSSRAEPAAGQLSTSPGVNTVRPREHGSVSSGTIPARKPSASSYTSRTHARPCKAHGKENCRRCSG